MAGRAELRGSDFQDAIRAAGGAALFVRTDITKRADIEAVVEQTVATYGRLDCAVNNAGIVGPLNTPVADVEEDEWDEVMNVNLRAVWMCMKFEIPAMLPRFDIATMLQRALTEIDGQQQTAQTRSAVIRAGGIATGEEQNPRGERPLTVA